MPIISPPDKKFLVPSDYIRLSNYKNIPRKNIFHEVNDMTIETNLSVKEIFQQLAQESHTQNNEYIDELKSDFSQSFNNASKIYEKVELDPYHVLLPCFKELSNTYKNHCSLEDIQEIEQIFINKTASMKKKILINQEKRRALTANGNYMEGKYISSNVASNKSATQTKQK